MRPSRRPTVTRNGRASIVAWFPQTPQPDAHHIHYRIRRFWEVMIVTRLGPGRCRAHPSARLSRVHPRTTSCNLSIFPACSRQRAYTRALVPGDQVAFFGRRARTTVPVSPFPLERDFFDEPRAEVFTCIRVQLAPRGGVVKKRGRGSRQPPLPPDYVDYVDDLMHE